MKNKTYIVFLKECYPTYDNTDAAYPIGYITAENAEEAADKFVKVLNKNGSDTSEVSYDNERDILVIKFNNCPGYFYNIVELPEIDENFVLD